MKSTSSMPLSYKAIEGAKYLFLALLAIVFLAELGLSLRWRLVSDSAFLHYVAYLINEHGFVPYRDIFEVNMPGTYLVHMAVGSMFGYSDFAFRLVDIAWLTATLTVTWFFMKPLGRMVATASCLLFGLIYLGAGSHMSFERDVIAILPIATAILLATWRPPNHSANLIHFLSGVLFACAALIKPYMVIGLPAIVLYNCIDETTGPKSVKTLLKPCIVGGFFALIGFLSMLTIPLLWLWRIGALQPFWELFSSYTPLYSQMSGNFEFRETYRRIVYIVYQYARFGKHGILLTASMFGVYIALTKTNSFAVKKQSVLLLSLSILSSISVIIGGKLWDYYWMPTVYFTSLGAAVALFRPPTSVILQRPIALLFPLLVFVVTTMTSILPTYDVALQIIHGRSPAPPMEGRPDEIAAYLDEHLEPNDTVQNLGMISGVVHAMLISEVVTATPYLYDFQFYHHISTPYIQRLREHFLLALEEKMPKIIVKTYSEPKIIGLDTTDTFPELKIFLNENYTESYSGNDFIIFSRIDK